MKNGIKCKKKIKAIIFMIVFMMCGLELFYIQNTYVFADSLDDDISYEEYMSNNVPGDLMEYFNEIYEQTISVYIETKFPNETKFQENFWVGEPFVINKMNGNIDIWYVPIYENNKILCIYCIGHNGDYNCTITGAYAEELNNIGYSSNDILFQTGNGIYAIDENNVVSVIDGDGLEEEYAYMDYSQIYNKITSVKLTNSNSSNLIKYKMKKSSSSGSLSSGGAVTQSGQGAVCDMNGCFVKQYDYELCWAASVATIIRYRMSNVAVNAFDIAILCDKPDIDDNGREHYTGTIYEAQFALCYYGVYYSVFERKLSMAETKREIISGNPIYMLSYGEDSLGIINSHVTVIYGFREVFNMGILNMWNPRMEEEELVIYPKSGDVTYLYENLRYKWAGTLCNRLFVTK